MSHKHSKEIARELKGRTVADARAYLEAVLPLISRAIALLCLWLM